ncbi:copper amine oxidase [Paenibacillus solani]|uniref:copper amine oxidase n=1 Tax=Paenibacillus solani TaxID=1705565 RepID=UPI003D2E5794
MKKIAYIVGGVLIGFLLATTTGAFADSVKSLIGKKVTGEYTVIVNREKLTDKGAIIDGKANVPVRGISVALGADIRVTGKTITVTSESADNQSSFEPTISKNNKYKGLSKQSLESSLATLKNNILTPSVQAVTEIENNIQRLKDADKEYREYLEKQKEVYTVTIQQSKESGDYQTASLRETQLKEVESLLSNSEPYNQEEIVKRERELNKLKEIIKNTEADIKNIEEALAAIK